MEHETPTRAVAARVKELRTGRGWSAQKLAEEMTRVGIPWERIVVTKLETGRRQSLTVDELLALAFVLDVAPVHLLVPTDESRPYHPVPTVEALPAAVRSWIRGLAVLAGVDERRFFSQVPAHEFAFLPDGSVSPAMMARMLEETRARHQREADQLGISYEEFMKTRFTPPPGYPEVGYGEH